MTIKTIIFDFGNVLYYPPNLDWFNRWKKVLGLSGNANIEAMIANPDDSEYMRDVFIGKISEKEMWAGVIEKLGLKQNQFDYFYKRFSSKRRLNKPMVKLLEELHQDYQTAILSNAGDQTRTIIVDVLELDRWVETIIISAEVKMAKPDAEIYELALERLGALPEECLFIDDQMPNVTAAKALGMQAVQFTDNDRTIRTIREILAQED
ncbi:MAG: HAD family phosphatase [Anaerolineaceae bacterium]|jgi:putative hydrolase of the HAD superfamily|nr:HAD family phosphatase [Anaerolineaceae bacterium]